MAKNFILKIGGNETTFSLEHRIFNISSFVITLFGIVGGIGNYLSGLHLMTVWLSIAGIIISGYLYFLSRIKNIFSNQIIATYLVAIILVLGGMFFFNGGVQGTIFYLLIMMLNIFLLITPSKFQNFFATAIYITMLVLIVFEFTFPTHIFYYRSTNEMLLDHILTVFYAVLFTSIIIIMFRKEYLKDRAKMIEQNNSFKNLNEKIVAQKNELESKAIQLELAINNATKRNEYVEILLLELNHRVKNNLQLVSSLILKQANSSTDKATKDALIDTKNRLLSLILLHQRLYGKENTSSIFIPKYLTELAESILVSYTNFGEEIIIYDMDDIWLNVECSISLGLIANEIITNSFKHAFINIAEPKLFISIKESNNNYTLKVSDNGIGMDTKKEHFGFGLELIELLTKQLKGKLIIESKKNDGYIIILTFTTNA